MEDPKLKEIIDHLPHDPGIYKFLDHRQKIIYIGKAKNLKKRVSSYFTASKSATAKLRLLVSRISRIEYNVVDSEFDALLLENSLIKKYQPRYNVNLKDGKTYPFICIKNERFPRIFPTRRFSRDGSEYFGPYASVSLMNLILDVIKRLFPVRSCNLNLSEENINSGKFSVCLDYHINLCNGPCEGLQSEADYFKNIDKIRKILKGETATVLKYLKKEMEKAASRLEFEKAQELKEKTEKLESFQAKSTVVNPKIKNVDVFSIYSTKEQAFVNFLKVVNGAIIQTYTIEYRKKLDERDDDLLLLAVAEMKERFNSPNKEVIVPFPVKLEQDLPFRFVYPKAGDKKKLLELSLKNARHFGKDRIRTHSNTNTEKSPVLEMLQRDLSLKNPPLHIECIDNSHLQGSEPVSAVIVFRNGKPAKKEYRLFNLRTVSKADDYAGMEEAVYRKYRRMLKEEAQLPDLLLIDGGKGQLNAALKSLQKLGIEDKTEIRGIAKRLEEIYQPGDPDPLHINKTSYSLRLIQHARNEAHRFAISHHRKKRIKSGLTSELNEISGIGPKTLTKLYQHFKTINKIRKANKEELAAIIGRKKAEHLLEGLKQL